MNPIYKLSRGSCMLCVMLFLSFSSLLAQGKMTIEKNNVTLRELFDLIEKQSDYNFLYNSNLISDNSVVKSISFKSEEISTILNQVLAPYDISYKIIDNQIILQPKGLEEGRQENSTAIASQSKNHSVASAQQEQKRTITGVVTAEDNGETLPAVAVYVPGKPNLGVSTDLDGRYSITVDNSVKQLEYQYLGFQTVTINIGNKGIINVTMAPAAVALNEVIVSTGYINEKKKNISGSVANVSKEQLQMAKVDNLQRALEGKAAGVQIVADNGLPGSAVNINIRGKSSISGGTQPLYIIDGVQVTTGDLSKLVQTSNVMAGLNPDDIESIDILKDAATASIYGAQAANGVIVIKTKRGAQGVPKITFSAKLGLDMLSNNIKLLNSQQYIDLTLMGIYNRYGNNDKNFTSTFDVYKERGWIDSDASEYPTLRLNDSKIPNDDWYNSIFRTGFTQEYQLGVSAGNEIVKSYVSLSYNNSDASTIYNSFSRLTVRANVDIKAAKWWDITTSTTFGNTKQRQPKSGGLIATPARGVLMMTPYNTIYNPDGSLNINNLEGAQNTNPVQASELNIYTLTTNKLTHSTQFNFHLLKDLDFRVSGNIDYNGLKEHEFLDPRTPQGIGYEGYIAASATDVMNMQATATLNYNRTFSNGKHRLNALAGFEYKDYRNRGNQTSATGIPTPDFKLLSQAGSIDGFSETFTGYKLIGLFARVGYTLNDKYIFNAVVRRDGSSRFGTNNKWGVFPSVSAAWRVGDETFIRNNAKWINDFKIKASYGLTGNSDIGNFVAMPQFAGDGRYNGIPGISPSVPGNVGLTWETKYSFNVGVDFAVLDNRISMTVDYFDDVTKDLLYERPIPINSGYTAIMQNVGSVRNNGIELSFNFIPVKAKDFRWEISPNFTFLKNRIVSLVDGKDQVGTSLVVGQPIDVFYTYNFAGVNPADGRPMWYDKNGYVVYKQNADDRVYLNGIYPTFYGGIINSFSYKGFDFSFLFQFQTGARRYNADKVQLSRVGNTNDRNQRLEMYENYWKQPGDITDVAQPMTENDYIGPGGKTTSYSAASSYHYDKTDFLKLKNISLGYNFPKKLVNKMGLQGLSVSCNAFNLWTVTPYTGYDPEFTGSDSGTYPQSRTITFTLKLDL